VQRLPLLFIFLQSYIFVAEKYHQYMLCSSCLCPSYHHPNCFSFWHFRFHWEVATAATSAADVTFSGAATSSIGLSSAAAAGTSAVCSALPSHDPGGLGFMFLQPPVVPSYPSFTAAFA
jgi:hypothetical protein